MITKQKVFQMITIFSISCSRSLEQGGPIRLSHQTIPAEFLEGPAPAAPPTMRQIPVFPVHNRGVATVVTQPSHTILTQPRNPTLRSATLPRERHFNVSFEGEEDSSKNNNGNGNVTTRGTNTGGRKKVNKIFYLVSH